MINQLITPIQNSDKKQLNIIDFEKNKTKNQVNSVLNLDYEELLLDLLYEIDLEPINVEEFSDWIQKKIKFNFWNLWYLKLSIKGNTANIDMVQMPQKWYEAMLFIIKYILENWLKYITWEANPQNKSSSNIQRRLKILVSFYSSFWFFPTKNSWTWWMYMQWDITSNELLRVLYNKTKIYIETKKWPAIKK